jgi:electron transfer flavoprotein beta subunit
MKIVVCVKGVDFAYCASVVDLGSGELDRASTVYMLNPYDELAVEEAIRLKERLRDAEITLITGGSARSEGALRYACAMGGASVDHLVRVDLDTGADAWMTATALADVIRARGFDVVLCGKKAIDTDGGQVGSYIAERLDVAHVAGISRLTIEPGSRVAVVERPLGRGDREEIECDLPALLTVDLGINEPRYPTFRNRTRSRVMPIEVVSRTPDGGGEAPVPLVQTRKHAAPRPKTRKVFAPDSSLSVTERLQLMASGNASAKPAGDFVEGSADDAARRVLDVLRGLNLIPGN